MDSSAAETRATGERSGFSKAADIRRLYLTGVAAVITLNRKGFGRPTPRTGSHRAGRRSSRGDHDRLAQVHHRYARLICFFVDDAIAAPLIHRDVLRALCSRAELEEIRILFHGYLDGAEQRSADAAAGHVRRGHQPADVDDSALAQRSDGPHEPGTALRREENPVRVRGLGLQFLQGLSQRRKKWVAVQLRIEQERGALQSQQFAYVFVLQTFDDYVDAR